MADFTALRSTVSRFLVDTGTIRAASSLAYDPELGHDVDTPGDQVWSGLCWVRPATADEVRAGEGIVGLHFYTVWLPWDTEDVEVDQIFTATTCADPYLIGRDLRVVRVVGGSQNPHRRLLCEDTLARSYVEEEAGS
jgi:hypothetical protein